MLQRALGPANVPTALMRPQSTHTRQSHRRSDTSAIEEAADVQCVAPGLNYTCQVDPTGALGISLSNAWMLGVDTLPLGMLATFVHMRGRRAIDQ